MRISFVVPVYKTGKLLHRCLKSLTNQDIDDFEILLIDDGSPDNSGIICDEMAVNYSKIRVFHKNNEGLGLTRNFGIENAMGDYIIFVDSDDYFEENALYNLCTFLDDNKADICVYKYKRMLGSKVKEYNSENFPTRIENVPTNVELAAMCIGEPFKNDMFEIGPAWKCVWKKEFLNKNNLRFLSEREIISEDYPFSFSACIHASSFTFYDKVLYYYNYNDTSLSHSYRSDRWSKAVVLYKYFDQMILNYGLGEDAKKRNQNNLMISLLLSFKQISFNSDMHLNSKLQMLVKICNDAYICNFIMGDVYCDSKGLMLLKKLICKKRVRLIYLIMRFRYAKR